MLRRVITQIASTSTKVWKAVNELTSRKSNKLSVKELVIDGVSITNSPDLSDAFNKHFSTIGPKLADEIPLLNNHHLEYFFFHCHCHCISQAFAHILIPGMGHLKFYYCPQGRAFAYSRDDPRPVDIRIVLASHVTENANTASTEDYDNFVVKCLTKQGFQKLVDVFKCMCCQFKLVLKRLSGMWYIFIHVSMLHKNTPTDYYDPLSTKYGGYVI